MADVTDERAQQNVALSNAQRQQQTATEIARKRVLEIYRAQQNFEAKQDETKGTEKDEAPKKVVRARRQLDFRDWEKYHSAWQDYYQRYYGEYYGKVAREYVAREQMRYEREQVEKERKAQAEGERLVLNAEAEQEEVQSSIRAKIRKTAERRARKLRKSRHFIPVTIGLLFLTLGLLFQYNQVIIANAVAYMSPGGNEASELTALSATVTTAVHDEPTLMIPKLNVEVPVTLGAGNDLGSMDLAMSNGVAQFSVPGAGAVPGEIGNFVISGHSAGNVYQQSDYKFIFSGLTRMAEGDLIYMDYESTRYGYKVTGTKVVEPTDVASLVQIANDNAGKPMITLLTCTPLGTSRYRLLVFGEQISPSYEDATTAAPAGNEGEAEVVQSMPANQGSPLEQLWAWLTGQSGV